MEIPDWIMQPRPPSRPTEVFVPVRMEVSPVRFYDGRGDGWQGVIFVELAGEYAGTDCAHCHSTQDEAWTCSETLARAAAAAILSEM